MRDIDICHDFPINFIFVCVFFSKTTTKTWKKITLNKHLMDTLYKKITAQYLRLIFKIKYSNFKIECNFHNEVSSETYHRQPTILG